MSATAQDNRVPMIVSEFRNQVTKMEDQFRLALPPHIPAARFARVLMTAVQREPKLLACDRQSLFTSAMQAANDGLLPDGREGVLVPFGSEDDDKVRAGSRVTWIPMVYGLRKKVRNAGILADWNCQVVQEGDLFDYQLGDEPYLKHKPSLTGGRDRPVIAAYSIAKYPDGTMSFEIMNVDQINDIREKSRAKKGPWADPIFFPEMCRKTVARLHAKQLPMSTDLDTVLRRDDALYNFEGASDKARAPSGHRTASVAAALDYFGAGGEGAAPSDDAPADKREPKPDDRKPQGEATEQPPEGEPAKKPAGAGPPTDPESYKAFARKVVDDVKTPDSAVSLDQWFASDAQRTLRNACNMTQADFAVVQGWVREALDKHKVSRK